MNNVKVSIIVPVYNVEKYIEQCLDSLVNQTLREIEIIIVDDESQDNSSAICESYREKDDRIKIVRKKNEGLGFARNTGLQFAKGKYIGFVDSDDYVDFKMFEILYEKATRDSAEVAYCATFYRADNFGNIIIPESTYKTDIIFENEEILEKLFPDVISSPPGAENDGVIGVSSWKAIYLNENFKKFGVKFPSEREFISEDAVFQMDYIPTVKKAIVIPDILYYYRENHSSLSMKFREDRFEMNKILFHKQIDMVRKFKNSSELSQRVKRIFIANVRLSLLQMVCYSEKSFKEKLTYIKEICTDEDVQLEIRSYPINLLPLKKRLVCEFVKYKQYLLIYLFMNLHEKSRGFGKSKA